MRRLGAVVPVLDPAMTTHDLVRLARHAEDEGYDAVFMPEAWSRDALCLMTAFAMATERITIGTAAISLSPRTPAIVGMASATIDDLSGGRFVLGIGFGHERTTTRWHGRPFRPSLGWMREYVDVLRRIHRREELDVHGEHVSCSGYRLGFEPPRERIPIWFAVLKTGTMRLAGEIADGAQMYFAPRSYVEVGARAIEEGLARAGRARSEFDLGLMIPTCVTVDPSPAREIARRQIAWYNNLPFYNDMFRAAGFAEEADRLRDGWAAHRERDPENAAWVALDTLGLERHVSDALVDAVVVVGDADACAARIADYVDAGVDTPIVFPFAPQPPGTSYDAFARTLGAVRASYR